MVGAPPSLHPCPPRASPTCPILYNIAPQVVLCPEIAPSASCTTHAPCLRLRAAHPRLALLGLSAGTGGRRLWRHPADRGLRAQGVLAALRRGSCGGICGLGRALRSSWSEWSPWSPRWLLPTPLFPSAPTRCPGHHNFPVLLFLLYRVMLPRSPPPGLHGSLACSQKGKGRRRFVIVNSHLSPSVTRLPATHLFLAHKN